ncbi:HYC_CC_PP family protein [Aequorivita marisscotiae]|uniref:Secreted protein n=1 Tax=Aequorivita marisscotiae TaxID=3040348 RepID=A0ABY8KTY2_9FLAO|nr:hypothetical protein [Aequorivita sp. Ant34-E75]WGF92438.1 hypothetical protein QCQ61_14680 [Aequorivita sp. Ant34-E75]
MKSFFHKSISTALATLVLFTTMSFTVDMHYCGEALVDFSVVHNVKTCGMEKSQSENSCENTVPDDSCCSDKQVVIEGQDELKLSFNSLSFEQQDFVATFFYSYVNLFEELDTNIVPFRDYAPPFLIRDIQKLHETYLI